MDLDLKPKFVDCLEWRDMLVSEWSVGDDDSGKSSTLDAAQKDEEDVYFQQFSIDSPAGRMAVKSGSAPSDVDAAIDSLVPTDFRVEVAPARDNEDCRKQATKLSLFGKALINAWRKKRDVLRDIICDQAIRRIGVGRVIYDSRLWPHPPADLGDDELLNWYAFHRRKTPIILERRNPRHVRWRDYDGDMLCLVEDYWSNVLSLWTELAQYPAAKEILTGRRPNERIRYSDIWIGKYRCIMLDDQPIFSINRTGKNSEFRGVGPHGYPDIPYFATPFRELPFENPERRYRGMLSNSSGLYKIESQVLTMQVWLLAWNAWRTWKGWTADNRPLDVFPGQYVSIDPRKQEYLEMMEGTAVPPEVQQTAGLMDQYIQRNGVAQGPRSAEGTRSAQQLWAIQSARQLKLESPKSTLQTGLERALYLASTIIEHTFKDNLTLPVGKDRDGQDMGMVTVGPQDIAGYNDAYNVIFSRRLDPALIEQAKAMMTFAVNNWMPMKESWRMSGLTDNPQEWYDALITQSTERLDFVMELIGLERARSFYPEGSPIIQAVEQRVMAGMQQGGAGGGAPGGQPPGAPGMPSGGAITPPGARAGMGEGLGGQMAQGLQNGKSGASTRVRGGAGQRRPPIQPPPQ